MMPLLISPIHLPTLLFLLFLSSHVSPSLQALPPPNGFYINCGAAKEATIGAIKWITDDGFIDVGNRSDVKTAGVLPVLTTLRYFPDKSARKYCYVIPVAKGSKYLVRTTYYYGGFDGGSEPPVFDQIIGGTRWSTVNTSESYTRGLTSYYEIIISAHAKTLSVCLARNEHTASSPFISALEVESLEDTMYNSTDFNMYALSTIARHRFGIDSGIISYPDDPFNRYWEPFTDTNPVVESHSNVSWSDFWNLPPQKAFQKALTTSRGKTLVVQWPPVKLPASSYYVALYFQDNRTPSPYSWRVFDVSLNGKSFYAGLNVSTDGVMVYGTRWPLSGQTQITLTPDESSPVGPVINAAEMLQIVPLRGRTLTRDVIAMEEMARSFSNRPSDWRGDPCLPQGHSWTGVACSEGKLVRVVHLNLTNQGISGSLPDSVGNLTALTSIRLGGNKLTGSIPDLGSLKELVTLHLENNQLSGAIPSSLGGLDSIKEIHLQNNDLQGEVPESLKKRPGIDIQV